MPRLLAATLCLAASVCCAQTEATTTQTPTSPVTLADQIAQILSSPDVARDHWGIYVTALDGTPIYALNEAQLFQPASNAKLFTTAAALTISDNELRLEVDPAGTPNQPALVTLEQAAPYYTVQNETQTVATKAEATGVQITRTIGSRTLRLFGSIAVKDEPDLEHVAIEDPAEYAAMVLR